jgi:hypothetical protein
MRVLLKEVPQPLDGLGVEAVGGLVEEQHLRRREDRAGEPEPLAHAERVAGRPLARDVLESDEPEDLVHPGGRNGRLGAEHPQVVAGAAGRMEELRVEVGAHHPGDVIVLAQRPAVPQRGAVTAIESEHQPHRRRLARAVGAEEARHHTWPQLERQLVDGTGTAVALAEPDGLDRHGTS